MKGKTEDHYIGVRELLIQHYVRKCYKKQHNPTRGLLTFNFTYQYKLKYEKGLQFS